MPTLKQQLKTWKSQRRIFGGSGVPKQSNQRVAGEGLVELKHPDTPIHDDDMSYSEGTIIGDFTLNLKSKELNFDPS